jgi:hypothetical protein
MPCALPYDIFVTTLGAEHHDPEERLWLRSARAPGALTVRDVLGNGGGGARLLAGARALEGTLALGGAEPVRVDAWLRRVNGRCVRRGCVPTCGGADRTPADRARSSRPTGTRTPGRTTALESGRYVFTACASSFPSC